MRRIRLADYAGMQTATRRSFRVLRCRPERLLVVSAVVSVVVAFSAAQANAIAVYFGTPGNAAFCGMGPDSPHGYSQEFINCFTPDDGFAVYVGRYNRPHKEYVQFYRNLIIEHPVKRLRFGETWRWDGFTCESRASGLTCWNPAGHGWWLGRFVGYRLF